MAAALPPTRRSANGARAWAGSLALLLQDGLRVDAIELSPQQSSEARDALAGPRRIDRPLRRRSRRVLETMPEAGFDAMVGYFMLHHLPELERYFRGAHRALRPGGRIVFVEPNPFHPLYRVQIACTPGMRWRRTRHLPAHAHRAAARGAGRAGFSGVHLRRYGSLPRAPLTTGWRGWVANACRNLRSRGRQAVPGDRDRTLSGLLKPPPRLQPRLFLRRAGLQRRIAMRKRSKRAMASRCRRVVDKRHRPSP